MKTESPITSHQAVVSFLAQTVFRQNDRMEVERGRNVKGTSRLALRARIALPQRLPVFSVVSFDSLRSLLRSCLRQSISLWSVVVKSAAFGLTLPPFCLTMPLEVLA